MIRKSPNERFRSARRLSLSCAVRASVLAVPTAGNVLLSGVLLAAHTAQAGDRPVVQERDGGLFPPLVVLTMLDGSDGFAIAGAGRAVAIAGDLNGDALADVVTSNQRFTFVLPGSAEPYPAVVSAREIGANAGRGIRIASKPTGAIDSLGGGGDVNGDGVDDLVLGAPAEEFQGARESGSVYVVFGEAGLNQDVALSVLSGDDGFAVRYEDGADFDRIGEDVDVIGDINGDNIDDLVLGAPYDGPFLYLRGYGHVVFGSDEGFPPEVELLTNDGDDTFSIVTNDYLTGQGVSGLGDVNGDGIEDFAVGSSRGRGFVIFGRNGPFGEVFDSFDGVNGFIIAPNADFPDDISLDRAGDVNGDGIDDILLSAQIDGFTGAAYVLYGRPRFEATVDLSALPLDQRLALVSPPACCARVKATPVAGDFDINADGFADVLVAAAREIPGTGELMEAFVVYGGAALPAQVTLAELDGSDGFTLRTPAAEFLVRVDVDAGGDVNGDGIDDLVLGTVLDVDAAQLLRRSYVLFGRGP